MVVMAVMVMMVPVVVNKTMKIPMCWVFHLTPAFIPDNPRKLKTKLNKLITAIRAQIGAPYFPRIEGEYTPAHIYGTVKIHKPNNPLRPIISQINTPTHKIAKQLDNIIKQYTPEKYSIRSSEEFLEILEETKEVGNISTLDVESLFTNVPVAETIEIILNRVTY